MNKYVLGMVGIALIIGGGAFYAGVRYEKDKISKMSPQQMFAQIGNANGRTIDSNGNGFRNGNRNVSGGLISGEIISKDADGITVKNQDGGSKIVLIGSSTNISKFAEGVAGDLEIGKNVTITGQANQDGSITAQSIQIRPNIPAPSPSPSK